MAEPRRHTRQMRCYSPKIQTRYHIFPEKGLQQRVYFSRGVESSYRVFCCSSTAVQSTLLRATAVYLLCLCGVYSCFCRCAYTRRLRDMLLLFACTPYFARDFLASAVRVKIAAELSLLLFLRAAEYYFTLLSVCHMVIREAFRT